jgi:hypothetical protein
MLKNGISRVKIMGYSSGDLPGVLIWGKANKYE